MTLAIISNREQYRLLTDTVPDIKEMHILCDNPEIHDFLREKRMPFDTVDEEVLQKEWDSINTWACEKALLFDLSADDRSILNGIEFNKALSAYLSFYLVSFLKNYLFSIYMIDRYRPSEMFIFDNIYCPPFPAFNGNYFLNLFLNELAQKNGIKVKHLRCGTRKEEKISMKDRIRILLQKLYGRLVVAGEKKKIFIACGDIGHLGPVLKKLRDRGKGIFIYNDEFRFAQLKFCLKEKMRYVICDSFLKKGRQVEDGFDYKKGFTDLIKHLCGNKWFIYERHDLNHHMANAILDSMGSYINNVSQWTRIYSEMVNTLDICGVIINQDEAPNRAFMAAFFKSRKIPVFCISHGYGTVRFSLPSSNRRFDLSYTFLHSEYEKHIFTSRGWDEKNIRVMGIPRYDRLMKLMDEKSKNKTKLKKMRILYCGGIMPYYTPDVPSYVGVCKYSFGTTMRRDLKLVMKALEGYPVELVIKPRYLVDEVPLADFVMKHKGKSSVTIVKAKTDFFKLLSSCQAVFLAHWSTAVMEGIIARLPTVVLSYSGIEDDFPFAQHDLCTVSHDPRELKDIIAELYSAFISGKRSRHAPAYDSNKAFYTGLNDGLNTDRVVDCIMKTVRI